MAHKDLKCENVLCYDTLKLTNLGFAKMLSSFKNELNYTLCGSVPFTEPEVLYGIPYDCYIDIWSMGVVFYVMLRAQLPFNDYNIRKTLKYM